MRCRFSRLGLPLTVRIAPRLSPGNRDSPRGNQASQRTQEFPAKITRTKTKSSPDCRRAKNNSIFLAAAPIGLPRASAASLVRAAREQCHQHHQVRQGKQPLVRLNPRRFRGSRDETQVPALREVVQVIHTNPREIGHLIIRENLLARFDGNHDWPRFSPPCFPYTVRCLVHPTGCTCLRAIVVPLVARKTIWLVLLT